MYFIATCVVASYRYRGRVASLFFSFPKPYDTVGVYYLFHSNIFCYLMVMDSVQDNSEHNNASSEFRAAGDQRRIITDNIRTLGILCPAHFGVNDLKKPSVI